MLLQEGKQDVKEQGLFPSLPPEVVFYGCLQMPQVKQRSQSTQAEHFLHFPQPPCKYFLHSLRGFVSSYTAFRGQAGFWEAGTCSVAAQRAVTHPPTGCLFSSVPAGISRSRIGQLLLKDSFVLFLFGCKLLWTPLHLFKEVKRYMQI